MKAIAQIRDANTGRGLELKFEPDSHGACVSITGMLKKIVIDVSDNELRVFETNEQGEVDNNPPAIQILIPEDSRP